MKKMKKIILEDISRNRELMGLKPILIKESFVGGIAELVQMAMRNLDVAGKSILKNNLDNLLVKASNDAEKLDMLISFVKKNSKEFGDNWVNNFAVKYIDGLEPILKSKVDDIEKAALDGKIDEAQLKRLLSDRNAGLMKGADSDTIDLVFDYLKTAIKKTTPSGGGTADDFATLFDSMAGKTNSQIDAAAKKGFQQLRDTIKLEKATSVGDKTKTDLLDTIDKEISDLESTMSGDLTPTQVQQQLSKINGRIQKLPEGSGLKRWWKQFSASGAGKMGGKMVNWVLLLTALATVGTVVYVKRGDILNTISDLGGSSDDDSGIPYNRSGPRETPKSDDGSKSDDVDWSQYKTN